MLGHLKKQFCVLNHFLLLLNIYSTLFLSIVWYFISYSIYIIIQIFLGKYLLGNVWPFNIFINFIEKLLKLNFTNIERKDLSGKVCIVTGGASGIGKQVSKFLVECGATVIIADILENKGRVAAFKINTNKVFGGGYAKYMYIDLMNSDSIKTFVNRFLYDYDRLDILINNAGTGHIIHKFENNKTCINEVFQTNYLGTFILTEMLIPILKNTKDSRIINTSSPIHRFFGSDLHKIIRHSKVTDCEHAYGASKSAILLYTLKLRRIAMGVALNQGLSNSKKENCEDYFPWSTCVNPGSVDTGIFPTKFPYNITNFLRWFLLDKKLGSQATIFASICPKDQATLYISPYWLPGNGSWFIDKYADFLSVFVGPRFAIPNLSEDAALSAEYLYQWTQNLLKMIQNKEKN